jgi:oligopeptide/dipeptide ABC transporter ATP-binding protein
MAPLPLLSVTGLNKVFGGSASGDRLRPGCHGVDLDLLPGETVGIVGESGSGKTTLGRCIAGLLAADSGDIRLAGESILGVRGPASRRSRQAIQMVFQNPESSLNPRMTVGRFVGEAFRNFRTVEPGREHERLVELAGLVGLQAEHLARYPHQLSGGQKQRVGIMRALACNPQIIVLDEPTSALDVSVQAQVLRTLREVQERTAVGLILISHDVGVIRYMCSKVHVMYLGRIVEAGETAAVLGTPRHPYTRALIDAVPRLVPSSHAAYTLSGDATLRDVSASACALQPRCREAMASCRTLPKLAGVGPGHVAACWLHSGSRAENIDA